MGRSKRKKSAAPAVRTPPPEVAKVVSPKLTVYFVDNFLTPQECERWMHSIDRATVPSPVQGENGTEQAPYRKSKTAWLDQLVPQEAQALDMKIAQFLEIPTECAERLQGTKYEAGDYYRPHWDWFEPGEDVHFAIAGQRTWSFLIYLNDCGTGVTAFTHLDIAFRPKQGRALYWHNLDATGQGNRLTEHAALPVKEGETKYVISKWCRERPLLNHPSQVLEGVVE